MSFRQGDRVIHTLRRNLGVGLVTGTYTLGEQLPGILVRWPRLTRRMCLHPSILEPAPCADAERQIEQVEQVDEVQPRSRGPEAVPTGISRWDWFAGQALAGLLAKGLEGTWEAAAKASYDAADAMLVESDKRRQP